MEQKDKNSQERKKQRAMFKNSFAELLEIPPEIALNLPKMVLIGNLRLTVENHQGIIGYQPQEIRIKVSAGFLRIQGEDLSLPAISNDEIIIDGEIHSLTILLDKEDA